MWYLQLCSAFSRLFGGGRVKWQSRRTWSLHLLISRAPTRHWRGTSDIGGHAQQLIGLIVLWLRRDGTDGSSDWIQYKHLSNCILHTKLVLLNTDCTFKVSGELFKNISIRSLLQAKEHQISGDEAQASAYL